MMMPRRNLGSTPRVGVEIEVVRWKSTANPEDSNPRNRIALDLCEAGFMENVAAESGYSPFHKKVHTYGCHCPACNRWEKHDSNPYPVQFTLEYDGSLPYYSGGEFISSPFVMDEVYLDSFMTAWSMITSTAVRELNYPAKNGGNATPSIHVHASTANPKNYDSALAMKFRQDYAPEIFVLALACGQDRGLKYRHLDFIEDGMKSKDYRHHRYMNVSNLGSAKLNPTNFAGPHIELRTWEAMYQDLSYILGALHVSAALSQIMSSGEIMNRMLGYTMIRSKTRTVHVLPDQSVEDVISLVDKQLFRVLQRALIDLTYVAEWDQAAYSIEELFARTEAEVGI